MVPFTLTLACDTSVHNVITTILKYTIYTMLANIIADLIGNSFFGGFNFSTSYFTYSYLVT